MFSTWVFTLKSNFKTIFYFDEAKNLKTLLVSLKNEAEAFQRHRTMSKAKGAVTAEMHDEMTTLQESTASTSL